METKDSSLSSQQKTVHLVHFTFSENFKSIPDSLQSFKSMKVRDLEIMGGGGGANISV